MFASQMGYMGGMPNIAGYGAGYPQQSGAGMATSLPTGQVQASISSFMDDASNTDTTSVLAASAGTDSNGSASALTLSDPMNQYLEDSAGLSAGLRGSVSIRIRPVPKARTSLPSLHRHRLRLHSTMLLHAEYEYIPPHGGCRTLSGGDLSSRYYPCST